MSDFRDVTPNAGDSIKQDILLIRDFLKNPIQKIRQPLSWSWKRTVLIYAIMSWVSGILNGLIPPNVYNIAFGIFFLPLISLVTSHILTGFFFYYFQVFEKREENFLSLFHLVVLANIPFLITHTLSSLVPPITLIGLAFSALLLIVGLTDNFKLDKRKSIRLVVLLYVMVFAVWLWEKIDVNRISRSLSVPYQEIQ